MEWSITLIHSQMMKWKKTDWMRYKPCSMHYSETTYKLQFHGPRLKLVPSCLPLQFLIPVDIGTGSGRWVVEVADEYPTARVIGFDLSPIQPSLVPSNAEFIVQDVNEGISLTDASTDLVHSRYHPLWQFLT